MRRNCTTSDEVSTWPQKILLRKICTIIVPFSSPWSCQKRRGNMSIVLVIGAAFRLVRYPFAAPCGVPSRQMSQVRDILPGLEVFLGQTACYNRDAVP